MKFSAIFLTLGLASTTLATPALVERADSPTDIIANIQSQTEALGSAINSYNGGDPSKVESASADLISTITKGTEAIKAGDDLDNMGALALTGPVGDLKDKVESVVDSIIDKKDQFVKAGAGGKVKASLSKQLDAAEGLASAITSKVPKNLQEVAQGLSAGISNAIQKGVDAYKSVSDSAPSSSAPSTDKATATASESSATETASATKTSEASATTSSAVIPSSSGAASSSAATPSGSASASPSSPPLATGGASKAAIGYSFGAVAVAAIAIAV
ncbi:hydrophobic surface binding protein A-domain-containing protein [Aspergillus avenaceus]|uniref:Cell wall mannoprotein 1 n=1 Tax=Aspergillus avenaceus TaxID=36643 RepID=A0A5N6U4L5_ASPAV|nr:hydrophobic surface binding protein A-domain-containing protein [Aspergillus avenaceus]